MKKIWITGAQGHVGSALIEILDQMEYQILATDKDEVNITELDQVKNYMKLNRPEVIINAAAVKDVKFCEENIDHAFKVNAIGVRNIALAAQEMNAKVIHISTDDVFDLDQARPYNEFDSIHPKTIYGKSKAAGEDFLKSLTTRYVILRSSWVYGIGKDFVNEVLDYVGKEKTMNVPNNRFAIPTSASELAKVIVYFIDNDEYGLYHCVCKGEAVSRYDFAKAILELSGNTGKLELQPIISDNTTRPSYSVLDNMMLRLTGIEEPKHWYDALKEHFEETGGNV